MNEMTQDNLLLSVEMFTSCRRNLNSKDLLVIHESLFDGDHHVS